MHKKSVPLIRQMGTTDCGIAALTMIFQYYKYKIDISELKDDKLDANCTYKNEYSVVKNVERTEDSFDVEHNVNELSGEHIIAFTTTHANIQGYTNLSGYTSEILFEP